jgi:hypothetical protein
VLAKTSLLVGGGSASAVLRLTLRLRPTAAAKIQISGYVLDDVAKSCYLVGKLLPTGKGNCLALRVGFWGAEGWILLRRAFPE